MSDAHFNGRVVAAAATKHPLQTNVQFILTDFLPNKNKQAIPPSEADNIMSSAVGMPFMIRFTGEGADGHSGARPIGPIVRVWPDTDNETPVLMAEAAVWNNEFADIDAFLRSANAENETVGTSWEVFYDKSVRDESGTEWLHDIIFKNSAIVKDPAYGRTRTRIVAVAETSEEIQEIIIGMEELFQVLREMWSAAYEQEQEDAVVINAENILDRAKTLVAKYKEDKSASASVVTELETIRAQAQELSSYRETREANDLFAQRSSALAEFFSTDELTARRASVLAMEQAAFDSYAADLKTAATRGASKSASAEHKLIQVPDLTGNTQKPVSLAELATKLNEVTK